MLVLSTPEESCRRLAKHRRRMQVRCQDPLSSNPSDTPRDKASIELGNNGIDPSLTIWCAFSLRL